ncbi:MAG TPA: ArsR family transcriptional regulator [Clostridiaceae bacterium]|nr:ArsR family transcriptional regulator [Clostridiaceae bacterium]
MKVEVNTKNMKLFEALSSSTRIRILELLGESPKNIGELARKLGISSAITTRHILTLEEAGLIRCKNTPGKRGLQKVCSLVEDEITLVFEKNKKSKQYRSVSIPIGQYVNYEVTPSCGLASTEALIGMLDDPRYFSDPAHVNAALLWFRTGWIEYRIPSYVFLPQPIHAIEISVELCSEFPKYNEDWPSDIHFYLNDILLGVWVCPGDFGETPGTYTPGWWKNNSQYGFLKTIRVTNSGCMLDGIPLSNVTLDQLQLKPGKDMSFKLAVPPDTRNPGGLNIFGRGFGNYDQDIEVVVEYE